MTTTRRRTWLAAVVMAVAAVAFTACGEDTNNGGTASTPAARPTTEAQLQIVRPAPNEIVQGPTVPVEVKLTNAEVVPQTSGPLRSDEGHIHLSIDGRVVSMTFGDTDELTDLAPGEHSLEAEFVAADHAPFANTVVAAVLFTVQ
ncbi:MAG: hypothetical protein ACRD0U_08930 [Acidimicrobiales bacterium]